MLWLVGCWAQHTHQRRRRTCVVPTSSCCIHVRLAAIAGAHPPAACCRCKLAPPASTVPCFGLCVCQCQKSAPGWQDDGHGDVHARRLPYRRGRCGGALPSAGKGVNGLLAACHGASCASTMSSMIRKGQGGAQATGNPSQRRRCSELRLRLCHRAPH